MTETQKFTIEYWGENRIERVERNPHGETGTIEYGYGIWHCPCGKTSMYMRLGGWGGCLACGWGMEMTGKDTIVIRRKVAA